MCDVPCIEGRVSGLKRRKKRNLCPILGHTYTLVINSLYNPSGGCFRRTGHSQCIRSTKYEKSALIKASGGVFLACDHVMLIPLSLLTDLDNFVDSDFMFIFFPIPFCGIRLKSLLKFDLIATYAVKLLLVFNNSTIT